LALGAPSPTTATGPKSVRGSVTASSCEKEKKKKRRRKLYPPLGPSDDIDLFDMKDEQPITEQQTSIQFKVAGSIFAGIQSWDPKVWACEYESGGALFVSFLQGA
jgi:hypothetical protein